MLLAIDPLAQLAGYESDTLAALRETVEADSAAVKSLWQALEEASQATRRSLDHAQDRDLPPEQFFVLIECADEAEQISLLQRFEEEGLKCQAKLA